MDSWWYMMEIYDTFWVRQHYKYNYHKKETNSEGTLECNTWIEPGSTNNYSSTSRKQVEQYIEGAWRMDIDIIDDYNDDESNM